MKEKLINFFKRKENILLVISFLFLIAIFLLNSIMNAVNADQWINSDASSEILLGKTLYEEKGIIFSNEWFYSTEVRVIYNQLIIEFLFNFTSNWHIIRVTCEIILNILIVISGFFLFRKMEIRNKWLIVLGCGLLLIPLSLDWLLIVFNGMYYSNHLILMFIYIMLMLMHFSENSKVKRNIIIVIGFIYSFIIGISTVRYMLNIIAPFFCAYCMLVLIKNKDLIKIKGFSFKAIIERIKENKEKSIQFGFFVGFFIIGIIGYVLNGTVLHKIFSYYNYYGFSIANNFNAIKSNSIVAFKEFFVTMGYNFNCSLFSWSGMLNVLIVLFLIYFIYVMVKLSFFSKISDSQRMVALFSLFNFILTILIAVFSNYGFTGRYYILCVVMTIPCTMIYFESDEKKEIKYVLSSFYVLYMFGSCINGYVDGKNHNLSGKLDNITEFLSHSDYDFGYATFWNANAITELTDGKIEIASVDSYYLDEEDSTFTWLMPKRDMDEDYHTGKVFLIYEKEIGEDSSLYSIFDEGTIIYEDSEYIIYHFENNRSFFKK